MFRYLALMWNAKRGERCAVAEDLARRLSATGAEWSLEFSGVGLQI
jgi:hypothetical protein